MTKYIPKKRKKKRTMSMTTTKRKMLSTNDTVRPGKRAKACAFPGSQDLHITCWIYSAHQEQGRWLTALVPAEDLCWVPNYLKPQLQGI